MDATAWPPRWVDFFRVPAGPASSLLLLGAHLGVAVHYAGRTFACGGQGGCKHCQANAGIEWRAYFPALLLKPPPEKSQPKILDLPESAFVHLHDVANFTALHLIIGREGKSNKSKITIDMPGTVFDVPPPAPFNIKPFLCRSWKAAELLVFNRPDDFYAWLFQEEKPGEGILKFKRQA